MTLRANVINTTHCSISIASDDEEVVIRILKFYTESRVTIVHEDAGLPGIIGPDLYFDLDELTNNLNEKSKKEAFE